MLTSNDRCMMKLRAMASAHRHVLFPKDKLLVELGQAIGRRMVKRSGEQIYQMLTCTLPYFPKEVIQEAFPAHSMRVESRSKTRWELTSSLEVAQSLGPLLQRSSYICAGSTKAFRTPSERVIRVVAKLMAPFEISHEVAKNGTERCYFNGLYALVTQDGEFHFPKDNQRRELSVTPEERASLRLAVIADMEVLGRAGHPLSPNWWRQLGDENKAMLVERQLTSNATRSRMGARGARPRRVTTESYDIEAITGEKKGKGKGQTMYLVRWAGYHETWEPWRLSGQPGDPIETWEPAQRLRETEALHAWKTRTHG